MYFANKPCFISYKKINLDGFNYCKRKYKRNMFSPVTAGTLMGRLVPSFAHSHAEAVGIASLLLEYFKSNDSFLGKVHAIYSLVPHIIYKDLNCNHL